MASSSITSWQIEGEKVEGMTVFFFLGFKITTDGDCNHEIKTFSPWKENYVQLRQYNKNRDITLLTRVHIVKSYGFSSSHAQI